MREKRGMNKAMAIGAAVFAVSIFLLGLLLTCVGFSEIVGNGQDTEKAERWFDPWEESEEKRLLYFQAITDPFANFEFNDRRELYFVMDEYSQLYVVCMDSADMSKYQDVYDYTYYAGEDEIPPSGRIEGYAVAIDQELKDMVIECFNEMMDEEFLTEDNFEDYVGDYYLDATYNPGAYENAWPMFLVGVFFMAVGILAVILTIRARRKAVREEAGRKSMAERAAMVRQFSEQGEDAWSASGTYTLNGTTYGGYENQKQEHSGNPVLGLIGALFGAALGGLLWIIFYKIGFIAGISGYAAVFGADWGYRKFSGRELKGPAFALCVILGMLMIVFANYISYAWEIVDVVNGSSPGSAAFGTVFRNLPRMMKDYELLGDFVGDLIMGLLFSVFAVASELSSGRRRH